MAPKSPRARGAAPDRRVLRTRRQLHTALINLILERGWDAVSVSDVCARADVGRSTFYAHFADKEELLFSGFDELHAMLATVREEHTGSFGFVEPMVQHARDNVKLFRAIVGRRSGPGMQRRFRDVFTRLVEAELDALGVAHEERALVAQYVSGGFLELLMAWLERPARLDSRTLAAAFRRLTEGVLSSVERGGP